MKESKQGIDIKKLNQLTWKRARPIILSLGLLLMVVSVFVGYNSTNNWHKDQNFIHSNKAKENYNLFVQEQKTLEEKINTKYQSSKDYQKASDYGYNNGAQLIHFDKRTGKFSIEYESFKSFYGYIRTKLFHNHGLANLINSGYIVSTTNIYRGLSLISLIFLIVGFLISFLDYKTNFVLLLFSSGYRRSDILKSSILTSLVPLIVLSIIAIGINITILYSSIPLHYINYPLNKIIFYHLCLLIVAIFYYFVGLFSGIIFGQVFTAIISLIGFIFGLELIKTNLLDLFDAIFHKQNSGVYDSSLFSRFDSGLYWLILVVITIMLTFTIYFSSRFFYNKLSLEERGNYILFPNLRLPISIVAALFTSYSLSGNLGLSNKYSTVSTSSLLRDNIIYGLIIFFITFFIFVVINNYKQIYERFSKILNK